jgi:isoleucyl-tRNA synthetase
VRFPLLEDVNGLFSGYGSVYCLIWTTTPWTIPANLAVAFHPRLSYALVRVGTDHYLLFEGLVDAVMAKCGLTDYSVVATFAGSQIEGTLFKHPIFDRSSLAVLAEYVTTEDGTGVVHTAPGHGRDDFYTGKKYGLPILCPVNEKGVLTEEAGEFAGVYYKKCDKVVVERLQELGNLLHAEDYRHSYPHAERDGNPVIFRATEQWFVGIDLPFHLDPSKTLRERMLEEIDRVQWFPVSGHKRFRAMIEGRPDWCISRQRPWGVGIPVFYCAKSGEPVLDPAAIEAVAELIEKEGSDAWYSEPASSILPAGFSFSGETEFRKEVDVFDVWFDSGSTSLCVLEGNVEPRWKEDWPADLYLEGSDQHRGWFNLAIIIGTACRGGAPYNQVLTHGFVTAADGTKMSKRLGNVVDPVEVCGKYGADILRLWCASVDTTDDVPCSDDLLKVAGEHYRRIRNTLRFLLGNLYDYDGFDGELMEIDRWIVQECDRVVLSCFEAYESYDFTRVFRRVHEFCEHDLSSFYLDAIKDRMYCDGTDWPSRRSGQKACHEVLKKLTLLIDPILMHTAEETYGRIPAIERTESVHMDSLPRPSSKFDEALDQRVRRMLALRESVAAAIEEWKGGAGVKDPQDVSVLLTASKEDAEVLRSFGDDLPVFFRVASVEFNDGTPKIELRKSDFEKCERSRVRRADVEMTKWNGSTVPLSARDRRALGIS